MMPLLVREKVDFYRWYQGMIGINKEYHQHYWSNDYSQYLAGRKHMQHWAKLNYRDLNDDHAMIYYTKIYKIWRPNDEENETYIGIVSKYYSYSLGSVCNVFVECDNDDCNDMCRQCIDCRKHRYYQGHKCPLCLKNICISCNEGYYDSSELCDDCSHSIYTCNICGNQSKKFKFCLDKSCQKMICLSCIDQSFYCKQHQTLTSDKATSGARNTVMKNTSVDV